MTGLPEFALTLLVLGLCQGQQTHSVHEEPELTAEPSKFGSLWPLPQKVQINPVSFKLSATSFQISDFKESSAGSSCVLLQNAYRRWGSACLFLYFLQICASWCVQGLHFLVCLCRCFGYMFGSKKQKGNKNRLSDPSELSELQVWITAPDSECDGYPSVTSDESCEFLRVSSFIHSLILQLSCCWVQEEEAQVSPEHFHPTWKGNVFFLLFSWMSRT